MTSAPGTLTCTGAATKGRAVEPDDAATMSVFAKPERQKKIEVGKMLSSRTPIMQFEFAQTDVITT